MHMTRLWLFKIAFAKLSKMVKRSARAYRSGWMCCRSSVVTGFGLLFLLLWAIMLGDIFLEHYGEEVLVHPTYEDWSQFQAGCTFESCFNISLCQLGNNGSLRVYVYPNQIFVDTDGKWLLDLPSKDYAEILAAIRSSRFYYPDAGKACVFIPSAVDPLNLARLKKTEASHILSSLPQYVFFRSVDKLSLYLQVL